MADRIGEVWSSRRGTLREFFSFADAKPDNLVKLDNGEIEFIDIKAFRPTGKALEWSKENADPLELAKYKSLRP